MRKLKIALWITAFVICAFMINSQSIATPTASNLSIYPNPFSPGVHPYVEISFVLSENPENSDQVKLNLDGDTYKDFAAGLNVRKIDKSFSDGIYNVNLSIDSTIALYGKLTVDSKAPEITNVSITPNHFSPNGDGINDYVEVRFNVTHTPTENDYLGNVVVVNAGPPIVISQSLSNSIPSYGARLAALWIPDPASKLEKTTLEIFGAYRKVAVSSKIEMYPGVLYVTDELYTHIYRCGVQGSVVNNDEFKIYWFAGDASVNFYNESGSRVATGKAQPAFHGNGVDLEKGTDVLEYFVRWGGNLREPDGRYICEILAVDSAGNISKQTGVVIIDNEPIAINVFSTDPSTPIAGTNDVICRISPQNQDGVSDKAYITYNLTETANVTASIFAIVNENGKNVSNLIRKIDDGRKEKGTNQLVWDGKDDGGNFVGPNAETVYTCIITATDILTGTPAQATVPVLVDNKPPDPPVMEKIPTPSNVKDIEIKGTGEPRSIVEIYGDDILLDKVYANIVTGAFYYPWFNVNEGKRKITAIVVDMAGNKGNKNDPPMEVFIDRTKPSGKDLAIQDWYKSGETPVELTIEAMDNPGGSGVTKIHWEYNTSDNKKEEKDEPGDKAKISLNTDGIYNIRYFVYDKAGNKSDEIKISKPVRIDTKNPKVEIKKITGDNWTGSVPQFISGESSPSLVITGTASDTLSGVSHVEISITKDASDLWKQVVGVTSWHYNFPPPSVSSITEYTIKVRVVDNAGNSDQLPDIKLTYNPPTSESATATPLSNGRIRLIWPVSGKYDIYRDTSQFETHDPSKLWKPDVDGTTWVDGDDSGHPTADGTEYYYLIVAKNGSVKYSASAVADKTPPLVQNISAVPSPFTPDGDKHEDITEIFFTLTETTSVTLNIYEGSPVATKLVRKLLPVKLFDFPVGDETETVKQLDSEKVSDKIREEFSKNGNYGIPLSQEAVAKVLNKGTRWLVINGRNAYTIIRQGTQIVVMLQFFPSGNNFIIWDGMDDSGQVVPQGRYIYKFEADSTMDVAGNTLRQSISGDVMVNRGEYRIDDISITPNPFSPDGDKVRDIANISFYINEDSDYVAGNIFNIKNGKQEIIAKVYTECLDYYWDTSKGQWVGFHVNNGIRKGFSEENYYIYPQNPKDEKDPPFHLSEPLTPPSNARTIKDYLSNYQSAYPNWKPKSFTMEWDGSGIDPNQPAGTYIIYIEASKESGDKTQPKTHEIVVEIPKIVPNDKQPPTLKSTFPQKDSVYSPIEGLTYVQATLSDSQGTGVDLINSTISLRDPMGETIPGQVTNDGKSSIILRLDKVLPADGSADGDYTIVVNAIDYAKNRSGDMISVFQYNTKVNDNVAPYISGAPAAIDVNGKNYDFTNGKLEPEEPIHLFKVKICDSNSGIDLSKSVIEFVRMVGSKELQISAEKSTISIDRKCGQLLLRLKDYLSTTGEHDGQYKLKIKPMDIAGNIGIKEYVFTYKTVEDTAKPSIVDIGVRDQEGVVITHSGPPFDLKQIGKPFVSIYAKITDPQPSAGVNFSEDKSFIKLVGPKGMNIPGVISYDKSDVTGEANINLTINPEALPLADGDYNIMVSAADNAGNPADDVIGVFEYINTSFAIDDKESPVIKDVLTIPSSVKEMDLLSLWKWIDSGVLIAYGSQGYDVANLYGPLCLEKNPYINRPIGLSIKLSDEASNVNPRLSYVRLIEPSIRMLFGLKAGVQGIVTSLDKKEMPSVLSSEFKNNGIELSNKVMVIIEEESQKWLIWDFTKRQEYTVKREFLVKGDNISEAINVYSRFKVNGQLIAMPVEKANKDSRSLGETELIINQSNGSSVIIIPETDTALQGSTDENKKGIYLSLVSSVPLSINGWYTAEVFAMDSVKKLNHSLELNPQSIDTIVAKLDHEILPQELITELKNKLGLSENVVVTLVDQGCTWLLTDYGQGFFDVYNKSAGGCRWRVLDNLRVYIIERKVNRNAPESASIMTNKLNIYKCNGVSVQIPNAFMVDNSRPEIISVNTNNQGNYVTGINCTIRDTDSGILAGSVAVAVRDKDGNIVPGSLSLKINSKKGEGINDLSLSWLAEKAFKVDNGPYQVEISCKDLAGNEAVYKRDVSAVLAQIVPPVTKVYFIAPDAGPLYPDSNVAEDKGTMIFNHRIDKIVVQIVNDPGMKIDYEESDIRFYAPNNAPEYWNVKGYKSYDDNANTITWNLSQSLATDGRGDGKYKVRVRIKAFGNGQYIEDDFYGYFIYDTQPPQVMNVEVGDRPWIGISHQPIYGLKNGGVNGKITRIDVRLKDALSYIDFDKSEVTITGPGSMEIQQSDDGIDTIIVDFAPLTVNGVYTLKITAVDSTGNSSVDNISKNNQHPYEYSFIYDTTPPEIVSVVNENGLALFDKDNPTNVILSLQSFDTIKLKASDSGVGVDPVGTVSAMFVYGPKGQMSGKRDIEGTDTAVFKFDKPLSAKDSSDDGIYTVKTLLVDALGNRTQAEFKFEYRAVAPALVDVEIVTDDDEVLSLANDKNKQFKRSVTQVRAILKDRSGKGINFNECIIAVGGPGVSHEDKEAHVPADPEKGDAMLIHYFAMPLANDGSDDGLYRIFVRGVDNDGHWIDYNLSFSYDCTAPVVISTIPANGAIINKPISGISARMQDKTTSPDLFESKISLSGPVSLKSLQANNGVDTISLSFFPLAGNGSADGEYQITVDPVDILGNKPPEPYKYSFIYDTTPPKLLSVSPGANQQVNGIISEITITATDGKAGTVSGINTRSTMIRLTGPGGKNIAGKLDFETKSADETIIKFILSNPLTLDGTEDGTYSISVELRDMADNKTSVSSQFVYTTVAPGVDSVKPDNNELVRIPVSSVKVKFKDNSGTGIDLEKSKVTLLKPNNQVVSGKSTITKPDTITFSVDRKFAVDGSEDGKYTIDILAVDNKGNKANYKSSFMYDTTPPITELVKPEKMTKENVEQVWIKIMDTGSGVNLELSKMEIEGPGGKVSGSQFDDGVDTLKYKFNSLEIDGKYKVNVYPVDLAGNSTTTTHQFILDTNAPIVTEVIPENDTTVFVALDRVQARLNDGNGSGVDLEGSKISLYRNGDMIVGIQSSDGVSTLIYSFPALKIDGSQNGIFDILVVARDLVGNVSKTYKYKFTYTPTAPKLVSMWPADGSYASLPIKQIIGKLEDKSGFGIDFSKSWIKLWSPDYKEIKGQTSNDGKDTLYFNLQYGLANDGTADGLYIVELKVIDKKNNEGYYRWRFSLDTTPARVDSVYPAHGALINKPLSSVWAKISDTASGIDIEKSRITLRGTDLVYGSGEVKGSMVNNGIDTISLKLSRPESLVDGLYTISVMPVDMQGNTPPEEIQSTFKYDTNPPVVVSSQPSSGSVLSIPLNQVRVTLSDGDANKTSGIDLNACSLSLFGPKGNVAGNLTTIKPNILYLDINSDEFVDGNYTMSIITQDLAGNRSNPINISFSYVTKAPALISVQPDNGALLNKPISLVTIKLEDNSGAGLDLANCKVSPIGPGNKPLSGKLSFTEPDTIFFTLDKKFATDGTDDGIYGLSIRAVDKAGTGFNYMTTFIYDTTPPTGKMTFPEGNIIKESFDYVAVQFDDIHSGINLEKSLLSLSGPIGPISGALVNDGVSTIKLKISPLPSDSSKDGKYNLSAIPMDMAGNTPAVPLVFSFIYDTNPPVIKSSVPADKSSVFIQLDSILVTLEDSGSGVDLEKSSIKLFAPDGRQIPGVRKDNGNNMGLAFPTLTDSGNYTISIIARDRIGNTGKEQILTFVYLPTAPGLTGLTIEDGSYKAIGMKEVGDRFYTAIPMKRVIAKLEDRSGSGIDLDNSWIKIWGPGNRSLTGKLFSKGDDGSNNTATIFYELQNPLANDGSVDGKYTIEINAVDKKRNSGNYKREFFYDTTPCEISALFISSAENKMDILKASPFGAVSSKFGMINKIAAHLQDSGIGASLDNSKIMITGPGIIEARQVNDGLNSLALVLNDLKSDGLYQVMVEPVDLLGNKTPDIKKYTFVIDTTPPFVSESSPPNGAAVVNRKLSEISVSLKDGGVTPTGIDIAKSSMEVYGPNGNVKGKLSYDADTSAATLIYKFDAPLSTDGKDDGDYTLKVSFADKAGNTGLDTRGFSYDTIQPGGPVISDLGVFPGRFSPNRDGVYDSTSITFNLSKNAKVRLYILDSTKQVVKKLLDGESRPAGRNSRDWDGSGLPDGRYIIKIDAVDDLGLTGAVESSSVEIDTLPPSIDQLMVSNNPFTPDGDGFADSTDISFVVHGSEKDDSMKVSIYNDRQEEIARLELSPKEFAGNGAYSANWNGKGANKDGEYRFVITARDTAGNMREVSGTVSLDISGPDISILSPDPSQVFYTNKSPVVIRGKTEDWNGVRRVALEWGTGNWTNAMFSGDKVDNDGDGRIDEEILDDKDDDGDGLIDEDLTGKGKLSDPVDWIYNFAPINNGEYEIKVRATDSINHFTDSKILKVFYDNISPVHKGTIVEDMAKASVRNGEEVRITTTWDRQDYKVTIDLSQLDSTYKSPVDAKHTKDGNYTLSFRISEENTRSDGLKTVLITGTDSASNRTIVDTFQIRLRNKLPSIISVSSERKAYANGSLVRLWVESDADSLDSGVKISADFSQLDSTFSPDRVKHSGKVQNKYVLEYTIGFNNKYPDNPGVPVIVNLTDGIETVSWKYELALDNTPPALKRLQIKNIWYEVSGNELAVDHTYADGSNFDAQLVWDGALQTISADFSDMDSNYKTGGEKLEGKENTYKLTYVISGTNNKPDGQRKIVLKATDLAGNASQFEIKAVLDNTAPVILSVVNEEDDKLYKNGDTVTVLVSVSSKVYEITADFSGLDTKYPAGLREKRESLDKDGKNYIYTIKYVISMDNAKTLEKGIKIPVKVSDMAGNVSINSSLVLELDNVPPELVIESIENTTSTQSSPGQDSETVELTTNSARITINGRTDADAKVVVSPEPYTSSLDDKGVFSYAFSLKFDSKNFITITALDKAGNKVVKKFNVTYRPIVKAADGGTVYLPEKKNDGIDKNDTRIEIPPYASTKDLIVEIRNVEEPEPAINNPSIGRGIISPIVAYEFQLKDVNDDKPVSVTFSKPVTIYMQVDLSSLDRSAAVYRWDGVKWNRIGGEIDKATNTVKFTVNSLSVFGVFQSDHISEFSLIGVSPNPFTPNDDRINDKVSFYFDNPKNENVVIRIFDLRGVLIRKLEPGSTTWDGTDDSGKLMEMGVYIYQLDTGDEVVGGTIVLAR